jgi:uncharacterized protein YjdB
MSGSLSTNNDSLMKKKQPLFFLGFLLLGLTSCIQNDVLSDTVEEVVRITGRVDTLAVGDTYQFTARFTNNIGQEEIRLFEWRSTKPETLSINELGEATGHQKGEVSVIASVNVDNVKLVSDTVQVIVDQETVENSDNEKGGSIRTTSSYILEGTFKMGLTGGSLVIEFEEDYKASRSLPGLYVYLTNNPNSVSNAFEIGKVEVFEGAHSYTLEGVGLDDYTYLFYYCKPFRVKVGDGQIE